MSSPPRSYCISGHNMDRINLDVQKFGLRGIIVMAGTYWKVVDGLWRLNGKLKRLSRWMANLQEVFVISQTLGISKGLSDTLMFQKYHLSPKTFPLAGHWWSGLFDHQSQGIVGAYQNSIWDGAPSQQYNLFACEHEKMFFVTRDYFL